MHQLRWLHLLSRWPSVEDWRKTEKTSSKVFISLKWLCKQDVEIWKQVFHFIIFSPKPYGRNLFRDKPRHFVPVRTLTKYGITITFLFCISFLYVFLSNRCHRHRHASRCFLGFSLILKVQSYWLISFALIVQWRISAKFSKGMKGGIL